MASFVWRSGWKIGDPIMRQVIQSLERFLNDKVGGLLVPAVWTGKNAVMVSTVSGTLTALTLPTGADVLKSNGAGTVASATFTVGFTGWLGVDAVVEFAAAASGERFAEVYFVGSGTRVPLGGTVQTVSYGTRVSGSVQVPCVVGDAFQIRARQGSGAGLDARVERVTFSKKSE